MAQIALSRDFLGAYARLPRKAQRKLDELLVKFRQDSTAAALHVEPIRRALDPQLRSARIGDDYRVILRAPERGDVFIALYADHHDAAYRWAIGKETAVHPATGTLQIFDVDEAARAVTVAETPAAREPEPAGALPPGLFADHDDRALFTAGVPEVLLPSVRAVSTDEELERLVPHLPPEAAEVLTGLAAGLTLDAALEEVLGRSAAPAGAPEPEVDTRDVAAALAREATQRQFFLLGDATDLDTALRYPLDAWRVFLHPKQRRIAHARSKGPLRVLGGAGTGKTVVALHRAAFLVREVFPKPDDRVLFTTFTVNLAHDLRAELAKILGPADLARVEVTNLDRWASEYLRRHGQSFQQIFDDEQRRLFQRMHDVYGIDGFDLDFCLAEWRDVIQAQNLRDEESYVRAVRRYRGVPLSRGQRRALWPLFSAYRHTLDDERRLEPLDVLRRARELLATSGEPPRYRAVVVDETQDLSAEALSLVRAIAGPDHPDDLFLVGDAHQRIYGRPVALSACGISVRGRRSQTLRVNYRTTASISRFALGALQGVAVDDLDTGADDRRGYVSLRDGPPPAVRSFALPGEEEAAVVATLREVLARGIAPEAVAVIARTRSILTDRFAPALADAGIDAVLVEQDEPQRSVVRLATLHRVKGLEFAVVLIVGAAESVLPYPSPELRSDDPLVHEQALLRERCLLYVAASRARDELYVSSSGTPSPFLAALPRVAAAEDPAPPGATPATDVLASPGAELSLAMDPRDLRGLPARMATFVLRQEITTMRDLAAIPPKKLLGHRNLGRRTIADTRAWLEPLLGCSWELFAARVANQGDGGAVEPRSLEEAARAGDWDTARAVLSDAERVTPLATMDLPARVRGYAEREGLVTLADLAQRSSADLVAAPNLGPGTVKDIGAAVWEHFARSRRDRELVDSGFLAAFKALLQEHEGTERIVLSRRSGIGGTESTLEELGETFAVSRERIRQIEAKACQALALRAGWVGPVRERIALALAEGAVPLETLAADPWWAGVTDFPGVVEFVARGVLEIEARVFAWGDTLWFSRSPRSQVERAAAALEARAAELPYPVDIAEIDALVHELGSPLGPRLEHLLRDELGALLHVERDARGTERVVGVGDTQRQEILAVLRASAAPMRLDELRARVGRHTHLPEEVMNFDRAVVGLPQHFPDFAAWRERLAPIARDLMQRLGPDRQWSTTELLDELREDHGLPPLLNPYTLAGLLRDAPGVRYLGRGRVALPEGSAESRLYIHEAVQQELERAGTPLPRGFLLERTRAKLGASEVALAQVFSRPLFVRLEQDRIGLRSRDVPGGEPAIAEAADHLESVLGRRDFGLSAWQAHEEVKALSAVHRDWPRELTQSVLRSDDRLRLSQSGCVGLASWSTIRVPTRLDLLREALAEAGGAVSIEALMGRIEALYGERPTRATLAVMVNKLGGALEGEWVRVLAAGPVESQA